MAKDERMNMLKMSRSIEDVKVNKLMASSVCH